MKMTISESCGNISRKQWLLWLTIIYSLVFSCIVYFYGWNFIPGFKFGNTHAQSNAVFQPVDVVLEFNNISYPQTAVHRHVDIHFEDPVLSHSGNASHNSDETYAGKTVIAIGGGITSVRLLDVRPNNMISKFQFFTVLLPSFCKTAEKDKYHYSFYLAYDSSDAVFSQQSLLLAFQNAFESHKTSICSSISMDLHFVECRHTGHPAWAQNDAMLEAYLDGAEYFYRVNDDSVMETSGWTEVFVKRLAQYNPPNVGVVGPKHSGGNELILTYDFVHKTHVELFGFYYPRVFTDWYADDWITKVYLPDHSTKIKTIRLAHTMKLGQRYKNDYSLFPKLATQLQKDAKSVQRYIAYRKNDRASSLDSTKVIALSLYGKDPRYTWGAIRNAQLTPVVFPGWTLRVYVPTVEATNSELAVPARVIACLKRLGAQIVYVQSSKIGVIPPRWWRYLVADDDSVSYFLIRDADSRLSERDAIAVNDWIKSSYVVHCIRDKQSHVTQNVVDGLWGGRPEQIRQMVGSSMLSQLLQFFGNSADNSGQTSSVSGNLKNFLSAFWPLVESHSVCHDSVSCRNWKRTLSFPSRKPLSTDKYLGQSYDEHHVLTSQEPFSTDPACCGRGKFVFKDEFSQVVNARPLNQTNEEVTNTDSQQVSLVIPVKTEDGNGLV